MAKINDLNEAGWNEWVSTRPESIQKLCRQFPPDRLYRIKGGNRVTILSYSENGTLTVKVSGEYNLVVFDRQVFGVSPDDLEECDLPPSGEVTGSILNAVAPISNN